MIYNKINIKENEQRVVFCAREVQNARRNLCLCFFAIPIANFGTLMRVS